MLSLRYIPPIIAHPRLFSALALEYPKNLIGLDVKHTGPELWLLATFPTKRRDPANGRLILHRSRQRLINENEKTTDGQEQRPHTVIHSAQSRFYFQEPGRYFAAFCPAWDGRPDMPLNRSGPAIGQRHASRRRPGGGAECTGNGNYKHGRYTEEISGDSPLVARGSCTILGKAT